MDQKTESSIINTIHAFDFPITLIMVAIVNFLSECDRIYRIENQKIIEAEKYKVIKTLDVIFDKLNNTKGCVVYSYIKKNSHTLCYLKKYQY